MTEIPHFMLKSSEYDEDCEAYIVLCSYITYH